MTSDTAWYWPKCVTTGGESILVGIFHDIFVASNFLLDSRPLFLSISSLTLSIYLSMYLFLILMFIFLLCRPYGCCSTVMKVASPSTVVVHLDLEDGQETWKYFAPALFPIKKKKNNNKKETCKKKRQPRSYHNL